MTRNHTTILEWALVLSTLVCVNLYAPFSVHGQDAEPSTEVTPAGDTDTGAEAVEEEETSRYVDLPEAISLGLVRSPQIDAQNLAAQSAALKVDEAFWAWTPKVNYTGFVAPFPNADADDQEEDIYADLDGFGVFTKHTVEVGMPVFTFFKLATVHDLAEVGLDVEKLKTEEVRVRVIYDVTKAFYTLQFAAASRVVTKEAQRLIVRIESKYWELWDSGQDSVKKSDRYRIEIAREEAFAGNTQAREAVKVAQAALRIHTGLDDAFRVPKMRFKPDEVTLRSLDEVLALAEIYRMDVQMLKKAAEAAGLKADLEFWKWFPTLSIGLRYNFAFNNAVPEAPDEFYAYDPYNSNSVGGALTLTWKLDPVRQAFKTERANVDAERVGAQLELARRASAVDVERFYREALAKQEMVEHARNARRASKRLFTQELLDYEVGGGDVQKSIDAGSAYTQKRLEFLAALHSFRLALVRLQLATGVEDVQKLLASGSIEDYATDGEEPTTEDDE